MTASPGSGSSAIPPAPLGTITIDELSSLVAARGGPHAPYTGQPLPVTRDQIREDRDTARRARDSGTKIGRRF